jgi:hypothetical protein
MLAEFALTPSIFDEDAHQDKDAWLDDLQHLGAAMFPHVSASPAIISNLYDGSWHPEATKIVGAIQDHRARTRCQSLLTKMKDLLVFRPACKEWPMDECAWGREAACSAIEEPIERIIASKTAHATLISEGHPARCISEVQDSGFWGGINAGGTVPMRISDQVGLLRKLCVHAEFLCLATPHIYGGFDDETDFAKAVIQSAFARPAGFRRVSIDIHTEGPRGNPGDAGYSTKLANSITNITQTVKQILKSGQTITLYVWPEGELLHRYVVGGLHAEMGGGQKRRSPRWAICLQHFARRGDNPDQAPAPWQLLPRKDLLDCFNRYFAEGVTGCLAPSPVQIAP